MNELTLIPTPPYTLKRLFSKLCIVISQQQLLPSRLRYYMLRLGGIKIGKRCFIGSSVYWDGIYPNLIEVGNDCIITSGTHILSHFFNTKEWVFYSGKVVIGNKVFIGMNTLIVNAVNIGDNAVIAAGSIVTHDIPAGEVWGGIPARFIKRIE